MSISPRSFFSIPFKTLSTGEKLAFSLSINSSSLEDREKFVKVFPMGETFTDNDLALFRAKYRQVYVEETERSSYLKSLCNSSGKGEIEKVEVLKDSAIHYLSELFDQEKEFNTETLSQTIQGCRDVVENLVDTLQNNSIDQLQELIGSLSFHDFYTFDHSINVSMYCILICRILNPMAEKHEIVLAGMCGLLHDIGKLRISTEIINKPGKLSDEEFAEIQRHPSFGAEFILNPALNLPTDIDPKILARVILEHHENYDGTGYPSRVNGDLIHPLARICAVADFFDAITTKRSYHQPLNTEDALALMRKTCGKKLDGQIFEMFAMHTMKYDKEKISAIELARDFDPCQPCNHLPLQSSNPMAKAEKQKEFGRIKIVGKPEDFGIWSGKKNVDFIESSSNKNQKKKKTG